MCDNSLSDPEMDLNNVMDLPHLSKTRKDLLYDLNTSSNEIYSNVTLKHFDDYQSEIIGPGGWKDKLEADDYLEFLAFGRNKCDPGRKRRRDHDEICKECNADKGYDNSPTSLMRLIRNIDTHAPEKIKYYPDGATKTKLYPNGYENKNTCVDFWMGLFPNLFIINSYLRNDGSQIYPLNWSTSSVPLQVATGLRNAVDTARNNGAIFTKLERAQSDQGGMQKIEVLLVPKVCLKHYGKVVSVTRRRLEVKHSSGETLTFKVSHSRQPGFMMIFGLETLKTTKLSSNHVVLLTTPTESVDDISKVLKNIGNYREVNIKLSDISNGALLRLQRDGKIVIQSQSYNAGQFNLEKLEGVQLVELLTKGILEIFRPVDIDDSYVSRYLNFYTEHELSLDDDAVYFVSGHICCCFRNIPDRAIEINSESELTTMNNLTVKYVLFKYLVCFEKVYDKMVYLAAGRSHRIINCSSVKGQCVRVVLDRDVLRDVKTKLVFLTAGPGEGKTEILKHIQARQCLPNTVVLRTSAKQLLLNNTSGVPLLNCVAKSCGLNDFETEIVKSLPKVILIDALDELKPSEIPDAYRLIHQLEGVALQVVVSVQKYLIHKLKSRFPSAEFGTLQSLSKDSQVAICLSHLNDLAQGTEISERFARELVLSYRQDSRWSLSALLCKMLAEIYVDHGTNDAGNTFKPLRSIHIYNEVINKCFYRYLEVKMGVRKNYTDHFVYDKLKKQYFLAHVYLAMECLLQSVPDELKVALPHPEVDLCPGQGLLNNVVPVEFIHQTFAEYILDDWVFKVITGEIFLPAESKIAFSQLFWTRYCNTFVIFRRYFLHEMLQERKEDLPSFDFALNVFDLNELACALHHSPNNCTLEVLIQSLTKHYGHEFKQEVKKQIDWYAELMPIIRPVIMKEISSREQLPRLEDFCMKRKLIDVNENGHTKKQKRCEPELNELDEFETTKNSNTFLLSKFLSLIVFKTHKINV